jgi:hypothetical protein
MEIPTVTTLTMAILEKVILIIMITLREVTNGDLTPLQVPQSTQANTLQMIKIEV